MRTRPLLMLVACGVSDLAELDLDAAADPSWPLADGGQLPPPTLALTVSPLREGEPLEIAVTGAARGDVVRVGLTMAGAGAGPCPASLGGECLGLVGPVVLVGQGRADAAGERVFAATAPARPTVDVCFQAAVVNAGAPGDLSNVVCRTIQPALTAQPGPDESQDV